MALNRQLKFGRASIIFTLNEFDGLESKFASKADSTNNAPAVVPLETTETLVIFPNETPLLNPTAIRNVCF